jgi:hypothetical protein
VTRPHGDEAEGEAEDKAWRDIVDNYGDRVELEPEPDTSPDKDASRLPDPSLFGVVEEPRELRSDGLGEEERFVPPPPPPLPRIAQDRLIAWGGLFGAPTILLIALVAGVSIPTLVAYALIAWFLGGFGYLVWQMPKGPADPWDDGARL